MNPSMEEASAVEPRLRQGHFGCAGQGAYTGVFGLMARWIDDID